MMRGVYPPLVACAHLTLARSPVDFGVVHYGGARTKEDQAALFAIGRTVDLHRKPVTWTLESNHLIQPDGWAHALDLTVFVDGRPTWKDEHVHLYDEVAVIMFAAAKELGIEIEWGGDWRQRPDRPHYQMKR